MQEQISEKELLVLLVLIFLCGIMSLARFAIDTGATEQSRDMKPRNSAVETNPPPSKEYSKSIILQEKAEIAQMLDIADQLLQSP